MYNVWVLSCIISLDRNTCSYLSEVEHIKWSTEYWNIVFHFVEGKQRLSLHQKTQDSPEHQGIQSVHQVIQFVHLGI